MASIVRDPAEEVWVFDWNGTPYPTVVTEVRGEPWLVMASDAGIMESAFLIDREGYLDNPAFARLGTLQELMS